ELIGFGRVFANFDVDGDVLGGNGHFFFGARIEDVEGDLTAFVVGPFGVIFLRTELHQVAVVRAVVVMFVVVVVSFAGFGRLFTVVGGAVTAGEPEGGGD